MNVSIRRGLKKAFWKVAGPISRKILGEGEVVAERFYRDGRQVGWLIVTHFSDGSIAHHFDVDGIKWAETTGGAAAKSVKVNARLRKVADWIGGAW